jgi:hypothetical protein
MRTLHLDAGREFRGGQWQALRLIEGLGRLGIGAKLLAREGGPLLDRARALQVDAEPLTPRAIWRYSRHMDLTHCHDARSHAMAAVASRAPVIVARRVAFPLRDSPVSRWKYRRAAHFIAVSAYVQRKLLEAGVPEERITVVYDGFELREGPAGPGTPWEWIVAPATADPRKGAALAREAAREAGVEIHYSGHLEEDLRKARLFVYLSYEEGLGSAVLLAMALGVPVIASNVGGLPELVIDGETGLLVENDPASVAKAIRRLLGDPALAASLAERARRMVTERCSAQRMVEETIEVYRKVLG